MSYRKIYNQVAVYTSCPATGYHYLDFSGNPINSIYSTFSGGSTGYSYNLIQPIIRVMDIGYGFNESRVDIKNMGNFGTIARPTIVTPPISLKITYSLMGLLNENRLGFICNQPQNGNPSFPPIYSNNICPISGFYDRTFQQTSGSNFINQSGSNIFWPLSYRDCRNFFVAVNDNNNDINLIDSYNPILNNTTGNFLSANLYTYAFGDCYLDSYRVSAAIGNFPQASVDYTCYNIMYYSGVSGNNIPSVNPKDFTLRSGITYSLPNIYTGSQVSVLRPGDISLNIIETNGNNTLHNLPLSFNDIKIQNFDLDISLNREPLMALGYRLPLDRRINPPVYCNLTFSAIVGDTQTGSFIDFINNDTIYDIIINMNYANNSLLTGTAIKYQFLQTKFNSIQISESIGNKKMANISLTTELNPNLNNQGFFMSGQLGIPPYTSPIY